MFEKFFNKILHEDEDEAVSYSPDLPVDESRPAKPDATEILGVVLLLIIALAYRLLFIYKISGPENAGVGWYGDTYHHWQIAYLTLTQGLSHGFMRLWDLKGMEFFWGPLHPMLSILMFKLTGSFNIVLMRFLSIAFGLGTLLVGYLLTKKFWGKSSAFAFLIFGTFFPIAVFNDATGSLEPIGVFLILLAIYLYFKKPLLSGVVFALSTMVRAEAWFFSAGLIFAVLINNKYKGKLSLFLGWLIPMLLYMKYLLDYTGNAIYPVWWNFLANAAGVWAGGQRSTLTPIQMFVRPYLITSAAIAVLFLIYNLYKKPRGYLLNLFGWGNIFFVGAFMGLSHYLTGWEWWFPVIRFFVWPYLFIGILVFVFLGHEERLHAAWKSLLVLSVILVTVMSQITWIPILKRFSETTSVWEQNVMWGKDLGRYYSGGKVLFPEGEPNFTYTAVAYGNINGESLISQMFDPYYYIGEKEVISAWPKHKDKIASWLTNNDIRLAVFRKDSLRYQHLVKSEPEVFELVANLEADTYQIYKVYPERIVLN